MDHPRVRVAWLLPVAMWGCHGSVKMRPAQAGAPVAPVFEIDPSAPAPQPPPVGPPPPLAVLEVGPRGVADLRAEVQVRFNQAVLSLGEEALEEGGVAIDIDPKPPGHCFWRTPDQLVFEPEELAPAQRYTVRVRARAGSKSPAAVLFSREPLSWTFETAGPEVSQWLPGDDDDGWGSRDPVYLKLSQPVDLARLKARLRVRTATGRLAVRVAPVPRSDTRAARSLSWRWGNHYQDDVEDDEERGASARKRRLRELSELIDDDDDLPSRLFEVRPPGRWPPGTDVTVEVESGLLGRSGPVPSAEAWRQAFRTPAVLSIQSLDRSEGWEIDALAGVQLKLSASVSKAELRHISVNPRPKGLVIEMDGGASPDIDIDGDFQPGRRYTVRLDARMRATTGYSVGDGTRGRPLLKPIPVFHGKTMSLSSSGTFAAATPPLIGLETRRLQSVEVKAVLLDVEHELDWLDDSKGIREQQRPFSEIAAALPDATVSKTYALSPGGISQWSDMVIDLRDLVGSKRGQLLVQVAPVAGAGTAAGMPEPVRGHFLITDLAPIVLQSTTRSLIKVVRLSDGRPLRGAEVILHGPGHSTRAGLGRTDGDGLFVLERMTASERSRAAGARLVIVDPAQQDHVIVPLGGEPESGHQGEKTPGLPPGERLLVKWVTERDAYRPGESVHVVGWAMVDTPFTRTGLRPLEKGTPVELALKDGHGTVVGRQTVHLDADGKCWATLPIPNKVALGYVDLIAELLGKKETKYLKVEDFRTPEYAVTARPVRPWTLAGEPAEVKVAATHYSGVPVTLGEVAWATTCHALPRTLLRLDAGWTVGTGRWSEARAAGPKRGVAPEVAGKRGFATFLPEIPQLDQVPSLCAVALQVQDAAKQAVGAETQLVVHPASFYLAVHAPEAHYVGERGAVAVRALDPDGGRRAARAVKVEVKRTWTEEIRGKDRGSRWERREAKVASCRLDLASDKEAACDLGRLAEGNHTITASAEDEVKRAVQSEASFWIAQPPRPSAGPFEPTSTRPSVDIERLDAGGPTPPKLRQVVAPGDHIRVHVSGRCETGDVLLLLERAGIREQHALKLVDHTAAVDFVTDDSWTPQVALHALIVCPPGQDGHATVETAEQTVEQPADHRKLTVTVTAPSRSKPGATIPVAIAVRDAQGEKPVAAHVALWAVDEAVLSLTNYRVSDPLPSFVPRKDAETSTWHGFDRLLRPHVPSKKDPSLGRAYGAGYGTLGMLGSGMGDVGGYGGEPPPPARARLETVPLFLGDVAIGADGTAQTSVHLPDNLTTFRITAMASARLADGTSPGRFGVAEAAVQVTAPFFVRAALPRMLRPNDTAEIAAIVENETGQRGRLVVEASITPAGSAALLLAGPARVESEVAQGAEKRVGFLVHASGPGHPEIELRARLENDTGATLASDAVRLPIPVELEPTLVDRAATYGSLASDDATAVRTRLPADVQAGAGGIAVSVSDSLLDDLRDAVDYLVDYPYGCIEQTSSRVLSLVAARQLGRRYQLPSEKADKLLADGVARIASMQLPSGGFAYWPEAAMVHPYATAFATWTLLMAKRAGWVIPDQVVHRAVEFLETSLSEDGEAAAVTGKLLAGTQRAIAVHVLAEAGRDVPTDVVTSVYAGRSQLPFFARALLLMALHRVAGSGDQRVGTLLAELLGSVSELPATAHVREVHAWGLEEVFHSDTRTDAMTLLALLQVEPEHPLVAKLVRGLLEHRLSGRWRNTQENAYAILAVLEYARRFESSDAKFVAEAWVNDRPIVRSSFGQPSASPVEAPAFMPMAEVLALGKPPTVVLRRKGEGRMYFRVGAEWASGGTLAAVDRGIAVKRVVRSAANEAISEDGGVVTSGEFVAFDLTVSNRAPLSYVAISVPVPAGLEPVLEGLGKAHGASVLHGAHGSWTSHQENRPDRILLFADSLQPGEHRHTLQLRAVTPGAFALPPARAEAMYTPETYGRSTSGHLVVKAP